MGFALLIIGLALVSSGLQNTYPTLGATLKSDFSGTGSFWYFITGIFAVGALGYYEPLKGASRLFILLIVIVLMFDNQGFFAQLRAALSSPKPSAKGAPNVVATTGQSTGQSIGSTVANYNLAPAIEGAVAATTPGWLSSILNYQIPIPSFMGGK